MGAGAKDEKPSAPASEGAAPGNDAGAVPSEADKLKAAEEEKKIKALEEEKKALEKKLSKDEIAKMSESSAHAILEELKAVKAELAERKKRKARWFPW